MRVLEIPLEEKLGEGRPYLTAYLQDRMPADPEGYGLPAVMVCPGGGYTHLSPREAEPIALAFAAAGYQAFVLYYSLQPERYYPQPLLDAAKAMRLIRQHAEEWSVDPEKVAMCGFSAGGHLTAALSTLWDSPILAEEGLGGRQARPDAAILGYAVVMTKDDESDPKSFGNRLMGSRIQDPELRKAICLPQHVTSENPPTFLWHTAADQTVPVRNSLRMAVALADQGVPFELHVFPRGKHGLALANHRTDNGDPEMILPEVAQWVPLCTQWLGRLWN